MLTISIHRQSPSFVGYDTVTLFGEEKAAYLKARGAAKVHLIRRWLKQRRGNSDGCIIICSTHS